MKTLKAKHLLNPKPRNDLRFCERKTERRTDEKEEQKPAGFDRNYNGLGLQDVGFNCVGFHGS